MPPIPKKRAKALMGLIREHGRRKKKPPKIAGRKPEELLELTKYIDAEMDRAEKKLHKAFSPKPGQRITRDSVVTQLHEIMRDCRALNRFFAGVVYQQKHEIVRLEQRLAKKPSVAESPTA
jgi:hypothetical protein